MKAIFLILWARVALDVFFSGRIEAAPDWLCCLANTSLRNAGEAISLTMNEVDNDRGNRV